jgi:hypothetical protein
VSAGEDLLKITFDTPQAITGAEVRALRTVLEYHCTVRETVKEAR